jgi:hypothetical protein
MMPTITNKDTLFRTKSEFLGIVGAKMRKAGATKGFEHVIISFGLITK